MPNKLHTFLHAGNVQARPVLGELFDFGSQTGLTGFFAPADEKSQMELVGYLDDIDLILVADVLIFTVGNEPAPNALMTYAGATFKISSRKTDQSAFVLGMKKITA